jgi:hypothetical protein
VPQFNEAELETFDAKTFEARAYAEKEARVSEQQAMILAALERIEALLVRIADNTAKEASFAQQLKVQLPKREK